MAFYEFRRYEIKPGKMEAWLKIFHEEVVPMQTAKGMVVAGIFCDEQVEDVFYWIRRFESEAERERLYAAVYESNDWKDELAGRVGECIDRETIQVTRLAPQAGSVLQ